MGHSAVIGPRNPTGALTATARRPAISKAWMESGSPASEALVTSTCRRPPQFVRTAAISLPQPSIEPAGAKA